MLVLGLLVGVTAFGAPIAEASHPTMMCLDIEPEQEHDVTNDDMLKALHAHPGATDAGHPPEHEGCVTSLDQEGQDWTDINIDFEVTGGTGQESDDSPTSPDMTCTVPEGGAHCSVYPWTFGSGPLTIRAWIDLDRSDATVEADRAEGRDEAVEPREFGEPDATDVSYWSSSTMDTTSESTVTIRYSERAHAFRGQVTSDYDECSVERTIKVFKRRNDGRRLLGTTETRDDGSWRVVLAKAVRGRFYAVAPATTRHTSSPSTDVTCFRARSETLRVT